MRKLKKISLLVFSVILIVAMACPVFATEMTGDVPVPCELTISVKDMTGLYPGKELEVNFADVTGTVNESYTIEKGETWEEGKPLVISLPAPTTYNISFPDIAEGYIVADPKSKEGVVTFTASQGAHVLNWAFISSDPAKQNNGISSEFLDYLPTTNRELLVIENEEAEALYLEFLNTVSFITTDETWYGNEELRANATLLGQYDKDFINGKRFAENYEKYVTGGSIEQYNNMPAFEQFLWTECYTRCAEGVNHPRGWNDFFGNEYNYEKMILRAATCMMNGNNAEVVKEAYLKLMDWQYDYIQENGYPFNFITNRSYVDEMSGEPIKVRSSVEAVKPTEPAEKPEGDEGPVSEESLVESPTEAPVELPNDPTPAPETEQPEEDGIWSSTLDKLKESMMTVLILIILAAMLAVVVFIRKRKNIDSDSQGGNFLS